VRDHGDRGLVIDKDHRRVLDGHSFGLLVMALLPRLQIVDSILAALNVQCDIDSSASMTVRVLGD
jgi:hypothetical protein